MKRSLTEPLIEVAVMGDISNICFVPEPFSCDQDSFRNLNNASKERWEKFFAKLIRFTMRDIHLMNVFPIKVNVSIFFGRTTYSLNSDAQGHHSSYWNWFSLSAKSTLKNSTIQSTTFTFLKISTNSRLGRRILMALIDGWRSLSKLGSCLDLDILILCSWINV